jgi:hypothetical protein
MAGTQIPISFTRVGVLPTVSTTCSFAGLRRHPVDLIHFRGADTSSELGRALTAIVLVATSRSRRRSRKGGHANKVAIIAQVDSKFCSQVVVLVGTLELQARKRVTRIPPSVTATQRCQSCATVQQAHLSQRGLADQCRPSSRWGCPTCRLPSGTAKASAFRGTLHAGVPGPLFPLQSPYIIRQSKDDKVRASRSKQRHYCDYHLPEAATPRCSNAQALAHPHYRL